MARRELSTFSCSSFVPINYENDRGFMLKHSITGWGSFHACVLAMINLVLSTTLLSACSRTSRSYDFGAGLATFFVFGAFVVICVPLFLLCLGLGINGAYKRETFGYTAIVLTLATFGGAIYIHIIDPVFFDTAERRARREQRAIEDRRQRYITKRAQEAKRANGDILISEDSLIVDLVTSRWWVPGCGGLFLLVGGFWVAERRKQHLRTTKLACKPQDGSETVLVARCPKCGVDVSGLLQKQEIKCSSCGLMLVLSRSQDAETTYRLPVRDLLISGSFPRRLAALLLVLATATLGLIFVGLMLAGQWIPAKTVAGYFCVSLLGLVALHWILKLYEW
jgi:hypothetical protein